MLTPSSSYLSIRPAGIVTCTKIQGSSITPGYSAQAVVAVGLISGLTGLMTACLPLGKIFYKAGVWRFRRPGTQWENAFPRRSLGYNDEPLLSDDEEFLQNTVHGAWFDAHQDLQAAEYDPNSVPVFNITGDASAVSWDHSGFKHTHEFKVVPHNETHDTYEAAFHVAAIGEDEPLTKRQNSFTGARVTFNNYGPDSHYGKINIGEQQTKNIAQYWVAKYINSVANGNPGESELCGFLGSQILAPPNYPVIAAVTIVSQIGLNGQYPASTCPPNWRRPLDDPRDELK